MKVVIIEDEKLTAEDLAETIIKVEPESEIIAVLDSVKKAISYFRSNAQPDLIFSDIQLGDGLSFEIFQKVPLSAPVIFCTAFDEYALKAFKANGIQYILKPFSPKVITDAFTKYRELKRSFSANVPEYERLITLLQGNTTKENASVLVYVKDKIIPTYFSDIAVFYIKNGIAHLFTFNQKSYPVNYTLEELENQAGKDFYRINRKFLINRKAIKDASLWFHRKLLVSLSVPFASNEKITVSKEKATSFLLWLSGK